MVSIRKYLNAPKSGHGHGAEDPGGCTAEVCIGLIDRLGAFVLAGKSGSDAAAAMAHSQAELSSLMRPEDVQRVEESIRNVLNASSTRFAETAQRTALETQHIVGVLNHALMVLTGGSESSAMRLQRIQESLNRASAVRDMSSLRASLADAMKLIREESAKEQEHSARQIATFETEVIRFRERLAANPARRLPGREGAIQAMGDRAAAVSSGSACYVAAFVIDDIKGIVQRYGPEPADELLFEVIRERLQPISPDCASWRWSPGCVLSVFEHSGSLDALKSELGKLCARPLVYRMTLGSRTAVLKVRVSQLLAELKPESLNSLVEQLDRFGEGCGFGEGRNAG
jgi:hypothetical protein